MRWKRLTLALLLIGVLAVASFVVWTETPLGPMPEAQVMAATIALRLR